MLKVSSTDTDKIQSGDVSLLTVVVSKELEAVQKIVNQVKDDHRYPQGQLKVLQDLLNILSS